MKIKLGLIVCLLVSGVLHAQKPGNLWNVVSEKG